MASGLFITFEGGEACGKSTQVRLLAESLRAGGHVVRELREPGGTPLGEKLRHLLKHDTDGHGMAPETELLLMNASRAELVRRVVRPALENGEIVLCDRFYDSTTAYQAGGRGLDAEAVRAVIELAVAGTRPDLTLLIRVPRQEALDRLAARNLATAPLPDRFEAEQDAFFRRVDAAYEQLAEVWPGRVRVIDGTGSPHEIALRVRSEVEALMDRSAVA